MKFKYKFLLCVSFILFVYGFSTEEKTRRLLEYINGSVSMGISIVIMLYLIFRFRKQIREKYAYTIFKIIQPFFAKKTYILIDDLFEENAECIDAYSLFLYLQAQNVPSYYVVWKENYFYQKLKQENKLKNIIVVKEKWGKDLIERGFRPLLKAKFVISAFYNGSGYDWVVKNKYITHIYLNHGITFFKKDILNTYRADRFNKLLVSNDIEKELYKNGAGWREENIIKAGLSRWDLLKREPHKQKNIFVFFTFRKTFHQNKNYKDFEYYKRIVSFFGNEKLQALLKERNVKLIYGVHHALYDQVNLDWYIESENVEVADIHNISQYIKKTDLFITDYSSIVFDFMYLDIPVIFYALDFQDQKLLPIDKVSTDSFRECVDSLYNCIEEEDELINKVKHYLDNDSQLEPENKEINNKFFYYKENFAAKIYEELEKL